MWLVANFAVPFLWINNDKYSIIPKIEQQKRTGY